MPYPAHRSRHARDTDRQPGLGGRKNRFVVRARRRSTKRHVRPGKPEATIDRPTRRRGLLMRDPSQFSPEQKRLAWLPAGHAEGWGDCFQAFVRDSYAAIRGQSHVGLLTLRRRRALALASWKPSCAPPPTINGPPSTTEGENLHDHTSPLSPGLLAAFLAAHASGVEVLPPPAMAPRVRRSSRSPLSALSHVAAKRGSASHAREASAGHRLSRSREPPAFPQEMGERDKKAPFSDHGSTTAPSAHSSMGDIQKDMQKLGRRRGRSRGEILPSAPFRRARRAGGWTPAIAAKEITPRTIGSGTLSS